MDWSKGFTAEYKLFKVDTSTWNDLEELPLISGSISRSMTDSLLESASIEVSEYIGETWVRVYLIARQGGDIVREPIFTGLASSPSRSLNGKRQTFDVDCYSVLKPAADKLVPLGYYIPRGQPGAPAVAALLKSAGVRATYQNIVGALDAHLVAEKGESVLTMAQAILAGIGCHLIISGHGEVTIAPFDGTVKATYGSLENDSVEPKITDTDDWYKCPNVLRVTAGSQTATVYDDDVESELSTVRRGREIWAEESVTLSDATALSAYTRARLKELQEYTRTISYDRRFAPDLKPGDVIRMSYPEHGIDSIFRISSQSIEMTHGARTSEEAYELKY